VKKANGAVVDLLANMLRRAEAGELRSVLLVVECLDEDGDLTIGHAYGGEIDTYRLVGGIESAKRRFLASMED
jgi:hypothetical protein